MKDYRTLLPQPVRLSAGVLGDMLLASAPFVALNQSQENLNNDSEAQAILTKVSKVHQELLNLQNQGLLTQEQVNDFRSLQAQAHNNPSIRTYALAQQAAVQYLREINSEISQHLGVDFASLARRTCGS